MTPDRILEPPLRDAGPLETMGQHDHIGDVTEMVARKMWDDRERTFPPFTRMKWEDGTSIARETTTGYVSAVFRALTEAGYAIVPIEPTEAMQEAGVRAKDEDPVPANVQIYRAMIAAAPPLNTKEGE